MNNSKKQALLKEVRTAIWGYPQEPPLEIQDSVTFFARDDALIYFSRKNAPHYWKAIEMLVEHSGLAKVYSRKAMIENFQSLIVELHTKEGKELASKDLQNKFDAWLAKLINAKDIDWTYYFAIDNLVVERPLKIGLVSLSRLNEENYNAVVEDLEKRVSKHKHTEERKAEILKIYKGDYLLGLKPDNWSSLASLNIRTKDIEFGHKMAAESIRDLISVLHCIGRFRNQPNYLLGLRGESVSGELFTLMTAGKKRYNLNTKRQLQPLQLDVRMIALLGGRGLAWFHGVLGKPAGDRMELENRVLNATVWMGNSTVERTDKEKFLKACIALEALLGSAGDSPYGSVIGDRAAFLLDTNPEERIKIAGYVRQVYRIRSKIAHEGKTEKEADLIEYLPYAQGITQACIYKVLELVEKNKWRKFSDLTEFLDSLKYA